MRCDFRWVEKEGVRVLQWREGKEFITGNPRYDRESDRPNTGKYITRVQWSKWRDVRIEVLAPMAQTKNRSEGFNCGRCGALVGYEKDGLTVWCDCRGH